MERDENYEATWEAKGNEWLPYVKNDVISTASCSVRFIMGVGEITNFSMKNSITLPLLANK